MPEIYRSPHTSSIADLIGKRGTAGARALQTAGDAEAQRVMASGQAWGQAGQNIAQGVSGTLADFARQKEEAPRRELQQRQSDLLAKQLAELETGMAQQKIGELASMIKASNYDPATAEPIFGAIAKLSPEYAEPLQRALMDPQQLKGVTDLLITQVPGYKAPGTRQVETVGADGKPVVQIVPDVPGQSFAKPPDKVGTRTVETVGQDGEPVTQIVADEPGQSFPQPPKPAPAVNLRPEDVMIDGRRAKAVFNPQSGRWSIAGQDVTDRVQPIPPQGPAPRREPIWVIGPDGQFQDLAGVAPPGSKPANTREQGRPVTSGDAGRIAELDTSLDDVDVLRGAVTGNNATGTAALIGTKVPNWVTEITGWGADAKSKNAVIARVKQVIGKALEGGVLRKEDEHKYKDILPTVGDVPSVVEDKIDGLQKAIELRRQRELDAREDAGYDVSGFRERKRTTPQSDDPVDALIKKYGGGE